MKTVAGLILGFACAVANAADVGVIVMHGKWGSPDAHVVAVTEALAKQGYAVIAPEMPWSRRRSYDRSVQEADAEIDSQIAGLRQRGAKRIVLVGHSLGAGYALHYAGRSHVDALVAIAPGHRPEVPRIAQSYADDVRRARDLVASGRAQESVSFNDFNTGARRSYISAGAASFVSYFDPEGPMNMLRNAQSLKDTPVLWLVPTREEAPIRNGDFAVYRHLPQNPLNQLAEPSADHVGAPEASVSTIVEWLKKVVP